MFKGLLGLIHLVVAIWAILNIVESNASTAMKVVWILIVLFFPVIGLIAWFFLGPKSKK